jgi:hypothetical protein
MNVFDLPQIQGLLSRWGAIPGWKLVVSGKIKDFNPVYPEYPC